MINRIMTFNIMTLSIRGLFVTLSIKSTRRSNTAIILISVMLSVAFYLMLYRSTEIAPEKIFL
jgi:hypothetical protein